MLVPVVLHYFVFRYIPMYGVVIAFKDFNLFDGIWGSRWVGLQWFRIMFSDRNFFNILFNSFKFSLTSLVVGFPFPIIFALLLNELTVRRFKKAIQTITYLPHFFSWVICGGLVIQLLGYRGPVNNLLRALNVEPVYFFIRFETFFPVYITSGIWKNFGWGSILYLAALSNINPELYEAAYVDGAGRIRQTWHVTLPGIKTVITILLILRCGDILDVGFDQLYILSSDIIRSSTDVFSTYIYRVGIRGGAYSYTAAIGLWRSAVELVLIIVANRIAKLVGESGIW